MVMQQFVLRLYYVYVYHHRYQFIVLFNVAKHAVCTGHVDLIDTSALWEYVRILAVPSVKRKMIRLFTLSLNDVLLCFFRKISLEILLFHWIR